MWPATTPPHQMNPPDEGRRCPNRPNKEIKSDLLDDNFSWSGWSPFLVLENFYPLVTELLKSNTNYESFKQQYEGNGRHVTSEIDKEVKRCVRELEQKLPSLQFDRESGYDRATGYNR